MRTARFLLIFTTFGGVSAALTIYMWQSLRSPAIKASPPALDCPVEIDLGPREFRSVVVGKFRIGNRGGSELLLTRFGTSCSCAGVEIEQDGGPKRVEELRVPAGGHVDLSVRISIATRPGTSQTVLIGFATNDADHPEASIRVVIPRVTGGLSAEPTAIVFGDIPVGRPATKTVRLYSNGSDTRRVQSVRSLQPDRFEVRLVPLPASAESTGEHDRLVAVIEVTARTDRPVKLDGLIEAVLDEEFRASDRIAVLGEVVPAVIALPGAVILPRSVGGRAEYSGQVGLTSRDGAQLGVVLDSVPEGLTAAVRPDPDNPGQWLLDVAAKPDGRAVRSVMVRLRADFATGDITLFDIPVTILPANP